MYNGYTVISTYYIFSSKGEAIRGFSFFFYAIKKTDYKNQSFGKLNFYEIILKIKRY
jgi:hypothetical protein